MKSIIKFILCLCVVYCAYQYGKDTQRINAVAKDCAKTISILVNDVLLEKEDTKGINQEWFES
mgnify:CR=1 FL=1